LSVRSVADAVATSTRAVYSLFGSKAGLIEALAARLFQVLAETIDAIPLTRDPVADVVSASVDGFRRVALDHSALYSMVFLRASPEFAQGPVFAQQARAAFARLERLLARVAAEQGLGGHEVADAAQAVHALTEGLATFELRGGLGEGARAESLWRFSVAALVLGMAGPANKRAPRRPPSAAAAQAPAVAGSAADPLSTRRDGAARPSTTPGRPRRDRAE
jgi:AcrR family transcriptional regulator